MRENFLKEEKTVVSKACLFEMQTLFLKSGAGFIVVLAGNIMTMPGLPKVPAAESIDIDENGDIVGIF